MSVKRYEDSITKDTKLLVLAKKYLDTVREDYSELTTAKDIIKLAHNIFREECFGIEQGRTITVQHPDGADCEWKVGERQCVCGNNRYYLEIEGDLVDGYYSYGQWC